MAKLDFDVDKIMKQVAKNSLEIIRRRFTVDINKLAIPYGEKPKITFTPKGSTSLDVEVNVQSPELKSKIDAYVERQK